MRRTLLKSKIHRATVTGAELHYEGSLSVCPKLMRLADLVEYEKILVANVSTGARFETYVIAGQPGEMCLNGAAARLGSKGDIVIVLAWGEWEDGEVPAGYSPAVVHVDAKNRQAVKESRTRKKNREKHMDRRNILAQSPLSQRRRPPRGGRQLPRPRRRLAQ